CGQLVDPCVVGEIALLEAHHVTARHTVVFTLHVDGAAEAFSCGAVRAVRQGNGVGSAVLHGDHCRMATRDEMAYRGVAQVTRILGFHGQRWRTSQLIPNGLVDHAYLDAAPFETEGDLIDHLAAESHLGDADVSLRIAVDVLQLGYLPGIKTLHQRL